MAMTRTITNYDSTIASMRNERRTEREPLRTASGGFEKAAILGLAHRNAKAMRTASPYAIRLAITLKAAWLKARAQGKPFSPQQADRHYPLSRLVANATVGARA